MQQHGATAKLSQSQKFSGCERKFEIGRKHTWPDSMPFNSPSRVCPEHVTRKSIVVVIGLVTFD